MSTGVLATVTLTEPARCPVASISHESPVRSVDEGRRADGTIPVEVTTDGRISSGAAAEEVFSYEAEHVYRLEREADQQCACERIADAGSPVRDVRAVDGELEVRFIASDLEVLRSVIDSLRETADSVSIRCLQRSGDGRTTEPVYVDRGAFTGRQRDVLERAHEMGYFARPRESNAEEVAAALDIAPSTFAEHLAAAQSKLMAAVFGGGQKTGP